MDGNLPAAGLNIEQFEQGLKRTLIGGIAYAVTTKHLCFADSEIEGIEALRERFAGFVDAQFDYMVRNARTRARNQQMFAGYDCKVVSLGTDCLSRTIPTRWGLKPPKALGERTHPFDLAVHPYEALCQVLDGDFATYLDTAQLAMGGRNYVIHKRLKIQFNHEIGEKFSENDYAYFLDFYKRRINNFREDTANYPVLFILHMVNNHVPAELYDILARRLTRDDWRLLVINTSDTPYDDGAAAAPGRMLLQHVPYPYAGYVWHVVPHFTTPGGQAFERRIVAAVQRTIVENFRRRDEAPAT
jgi:hypothetical protein